MVQPAILPPTVDSLSQLSKIEGPDRCVLTVYLPGSRSRSKRRTKLADLPESLLNLEELTEDEAEHERRSVELWQAVVSDISLPPADGWVGVVSWLTDDAVFVQLPAEVEPAVHLDNSPFLLPAARLLDDLETYAVVYADHRRADIYLAALGKLHEANRLRGEIKNHVRKGGWSQQRYERRRDKQIHHYCRGIIEHLDELVQSEGLRRIVLVGDRFLLGELEKRLSPNMRDMIVCTLVAEPGKDTRDLFKETMSAAAEEERAEERWLRDKIVGAHAGGGKAVVGPADTLAALRERRVRWLLIGPLKDVDFWRCRSCGESDLGQPTACPKCAAATYEQSAANELMDLAFAGGSRVELTEHVLPDLGGVGALLRW